MSVPGFSAEVSLYKSSLDFAPTAAQGSQFSAGAVVPQLPATGCGECTPITWPDGTHTGTCRRACCDWFGCRTESCSCGGGTSWGGVFGGTGAIFRM